MEDLEQRVTQLEKYLKWLLGASGLTFVTVIAAAFWLGATYNTVKDSSEKVTKISQAVFENKDSLMSRTSVIETKLDSIDKKLPGGPIRGQVLRP